MGADISDQEVEKVSTLRDGVASLIGGVVLAAFNLLYFLRDSDSAFDQPATWVRVVILILAGGFGAIAWARWLRGGPISGGRHFLLTFGVVVITAMGMYVGTALFMIHQRSEPFDVSFAEELAGREKVVLGKKASGFLESQLAIRYGGSLGPDDVDIDFELYEDPDHPRAQYIVVMVGTADHGSSLADNLADDFDDEITATLLADASDVSESQSIDGAPGQMRCGRASSGGVTASICAYAYGVRSVLIILPPREAEPDDLASAMLADMLS